MLQLVPEDADNCGDLFDAGGGQLTDHGAERLLLGYLLSKPAAVTETVEILQAADLHDPLHRRIYEVLCRSYDTDMPLTMEMLVTGLGGGKTVGPIIASLIAQADMSIDAAEVGEHLQAISERRAVGTADDDYVAGAPFMSKFGAQRWEDIAASNGSGGYRWFVEDIIPLGEISLVFGDSGSGKSFGMFDMAMCGARGVTFHGHNVEPGLIVYVAAEAGKGFGKRKIAYAIQHRLEPSEPLPFVLLTKRPDFFHDDADAIALIEEIRAIKRMYRQRLVMVVIDTLSALAPGMNENASADVSAVRRRLVMMQEQLDEAAIALVHHKPKGGSTPRGHGSLTADFETTIEFETAGDRHRATVRKQREGKAGMSWEFRLPVIEVGRNKWGNPETSCVVEPCAVDRKSSTLGFHANPTEALFMRALYESMIDHALPPPAGLPASVTKVVEFRRVRALMRERIIPAHEDNAIADGRFRTAFSRAGAKLRDGGVIGIQGNLLWPSGKPVNGVTGPTI